MSSPAALQVQPAEALALTLPWGEAGTPAL
jgi:hypothetical protein